MPLHVPSFATIQLKHMNVAEIRGHVLAELLLQLRYALPTEAYLLLMEISPLRQQSWSVLLRDLWNMSGRRLGTETIPPFDP